MVQSQRFNLISLLLFMSLCLIVHARVVLHRPNLSDEDGLASMDINGLLPIEYDAGSHLDQRRDVFDPNAIQSIYDGALIRQMINHQRNSKRSKLNLHTNLNLPRYLRSVN
ncbi:unnamed protein product [Adineta ricciae]|uniref:Uncharacterized protein n=1 Tax=Adineta ricciae TaxID=249248 RepID=A0A814UPE8_ADIRI|nr:unnamed protein product [Adineta ricciae]CAF1213588.1 unnamed protein product [Adineta ricciae]